MLAEVSTKELSEIEGGAVPGIVWAAVAAFGAVSSYFVGEASGRIQAKRDRDQDIRIAGAYGLALSAGASDSWSDCGARHGRRADRN